MIPRDGRQEVVSARSGDVPAEPKASRYELTLFVTGASTMSARAVADVRKLCETHLHERYELSVIDVHMNPDLVRSRGVLAFPTLIKDAPLPRRVIVGDLSDANRVLAALDIAVAYDTAPEPV